MDYCGGLGSAARPTSACSRTATSIYRPPRADQAPSQPSLVRAHQAALEQPLSVLLARRLRPRRPRSHLARTPDAHASLRRGALEGICIELRRRRDPVPLHRGGTRSKATIPSAKRAGRLRERWTALESSMNRPSPFILCDRVGRCSGSRGSLSPGLSFRSTRCTGASAPMTGCRRVSTMGSGALTRVPLSPRCSAGPTFALLARSGQGPRRARHRETET